MKRTLCNQIALLGGIALLATAASAQTWQTVDNFNYAPGRYYAAAEAITCDPFGIVFAAGMAQEPVAFPFYHGAIRGSIDDGATWATADDLLPTYGATYWGITSDSVGNLYAVGRASASPFGFVRQSTDGGLTWQTVDSLNTYMPKGVACDSAGNVYVAGYTGTVNTGTWVVRKGVNVGGVWVWTTVDTFNSNSNAFACAVFCHPNGSVFVGGNAAIKSGKSIVNAGTIRRSTDGGVTWTTVDTGFLGNCNALGADAQGNLYAVGSWIVRKSTNNGSTWTTVDSPSGQNYAYGFAKDSNGNLFVAGTLGGAWAVRESVGGTGPWKTVDTFQLAPSNGLNIFACARGIAADATGHVYVAGNTDDASGLGHWIVRKN